MSTTLIDPSHPAFTLPFCIPPSFLPTQASYALGYNLAIEYLADYEKTWMLDSFRDINTRVLNKDIDWIFLEVRLLQIFSPKQFIRQQ